MSNSLSGAPTGRGERVLAIATAVLAAVSSLCLLVVLISPLFGVDFTTDAAWFWPIALTITWWGLPLTPVGVVAVVVWHWRANRRHQ